MGARNPCDSYANDTGGIRCMHCGWVEDAHVSPETGVARLDCRADSTQSVSAQGIGAALRAARELLDMSMGDMAHNLAKSVTLISDWELGRVVMSRAEVADYFRRLADRAEDGDLAFDGPRERRRDGT